MPVRLAKKALRAEKTLCLDRMEIEPLERLRARAAPREPSTTVIPTTTTRASSLPEDSLTRDLKQFVISQVGDLVPRLVSQQVQDLQRGSLKKEASRTEEQGISLKS